MEVSDAISDLEGRKGVVVRFHLVTNHVVIISLKPENQYGHTLTFFKTSFWVE